MTGTTIEERAYHQAATGERRNPAPFAIEKLHDAII